MGVLLIGLIVTIVSSSRLVHAVKGYAVLPADSNDAAMPVVVTETRLPDAGGPKNDGILAVFSNSAPHFLALTPFGGGVLAPLMWSRI